MPATIKRRKLGVASQNTQRKGGISTFTTVSKATTTVKVVLDKNHYVDSTILVPTKEQPPNARKRKSGEDEADAPVALVGRKVKPLPQKKSTIELAIPQTHNDQKSKTAAVLSVRTPSKGACFLFNRLNLPETPSRSPRSNSSTFTSSIDVSTLKSSPRSPEPLPNEILDLINLHASFLTTLSIHYAHNGIHSPADLRALCPDVARSWGKRKVVVEDIRMTLGVLNTGDLLEKKEEQFSISKLSLSDYGHGKICVLIRNSTTKTGNLVRPLNEDVMNDLFTSSIQKLWKQKEEDQTPAEFIANLPTEPIKPNSSFTGTSPMLAKGQRRLEDLKIGLAAKKEEKQQKIEEKKITLPKTSLIERLRAKQLHQATLSPGLTKEQIARRGALARVEDVVSVLSMLSMSGSIGQNRVSFTLSTVLGKLKDSFRTPISLEEGDACLRVLAAEVAPEWVRMVKMGKVEALVVNRGKRLSEGEARERVSMLQVV